MSIPVALKKSFHNLLSATFSYSIYFLISIKPSEEKKKSERESKRNKERSVERLREWCIKMKADFLRLSSTLTRFSWSGVNRRARLHMCGHKDLGFFFSFLREREREGGEGGRETASTCREELGRETEQ